jgi:hypothetical protein
VPVIEALPYIYDVVLLESGTALAGGYGDIWASDDMGLSYDPGVEGEKLEPTDLERWSVHR